MHTQARTAGKITLSAVVVMALVALPVAFVLATGSGPYEAVIRVFPGYVVAVGSALLLVVAEAASLLSIGGLVYLLFLRDVTPRDGSALSPHGMDLVLLRIASVIWAVAAGVLVVFDALNSTGVGFTEVGRPGALSYVLDAAVNPGALVIRFVAAVVVAVTANLATRWTTLLVSLWASAIAVLSPIVVGQVLVGPSHDIGGDAAVIQALAAYPLLGGLVVLAAMQLFGTGSTPRVWRRFRTLAMVAFPVVLVTEGIVSWFKLAGTDVTASATGWLILGHWAALAAAAGALLATFWRAIRSPALVIALVSGAAWVAINVTMTHEPPPQFFVPTTVPQIFLGFDPVEAPTARVLLTHWRINLLFLAIAVAAVSVYAVALRAVRLRGVAWPVGRTVAWILGWGVVVVVTSSGLGKYSAPHFGIHMIVHMSLSMLAPILLSLGGVITLLLRASKAGGSRYGVHDWLTWVMGWRLLRLIYNPMLVFTVFIASYYGLYFTGIFESLMRYHWGHQLMNTHFLIVGYLYYSLIIGVDRPPRPLPHIAKLGLAMVAMPFHAFFGVILMRGQTIAQNYYEYLDMPWADLPAAQEMGGGVAWVGGEIPALIVVIALGAQWARQDHREAARTDRHFDSGLDLEYEEYNKMLQRLSKRGSPTSQTHVEDD